VAAGCEVRILVYGQDQDAVLRMRDVVIQRIKMLNKFCLVLVLLEKTEKLSMQNSPN
jgi:hypothetical protein